jgi:ABC-2 type transport system permease protein
MNREILRVTARQLLGRRRTLLMLLLAAVPVLVALVFRIGGVEAGSIPGDQDFLLAVFDGLLVTLLLPLIALLFGTATFGAEIEEGTVIYLLAKPIPRWRTLLAKLVVATLATMLLVGGATLLSGLVAVAGVPEATGVIVGYTVGVAAGSIFYTTVFVALSLLTSRALIVGLVFILLWEGVLANFLSGIRFLSIRQYTLGIADAAGVAGRVTRDVLDAPPAVALGVVVTAVALLVAVRRLEGFEIPQED